MYPAVQCTHTPLKDSFKERNIKTQKQERLTFFERSQIM